MLPLLRPFSLVPGCALVVTLAGCVSEAERREVSRIRRPAMPAMAEGPRGLMVAPGESGVRATALQRVGDGNLAGAGRVLDGLEDRDARERLAREIAASLAATRPMDAVAFALSLAPGPAQTAALEVGARSWLRRDAATALRWAMELADPTTTRVVRRAVADESAGVAPAATLARLLALPAEPGRDEVLGLAAAAWVRRDADAAEAWLQRLPAGDLRQRLTAQMGFELAQTHPRRAIPLAETLAPGRDRWLLVTAITQTWVAVDAPAAFAWTRQLGPGEAHTAAVAGLDAGLGVAVSRRGATVLDTRGGTSRRRAGGTVRELEPGDDGAFATWRGQQAPGLPRDEAVLEYVRQRGALEPMLIGPWVAQLPGGPGRDRAIEVFWETLVRVSPAEAAQWLEALPRSDRSDEKMEQTVREWLRTDPAGAAAWLRRSTLPPERIEALLQGRGQP